MQLHVRLRPAEPAYEKKRKTFTRLRMHSACIIESMQLRKRWLACVHVSIEGLGHAPGNGFASELFKRSHAALLANDEAHRLDHHRLAVDQQRIGEQDLDLLVIEQVSNGKANFEAM